MREVELVKFLTTDEEDCISEVNMIGNSAVYSLLGICDAKLHPVLKGEEKSLAVSLPGV